MGIRMLILLGYSVARLLRRSMRQSRILRLHNLALTPLNIAVRLDRRLELTGIDGEYEHNILRQYILYSLRRSNLTAERSGCVLC